ncbi:MAG: TolC family protein [Candidatus Ozemobacteraceae bacterium]
MGTISLLLPLLLVVWVPAAGICAESIASATSFDLLSCINSALETNPRLLAQKQESIGAKARFSRAKSAQLPRIKAEETFTRLKDPLAFELPGAGKMTLGDDKIQIKTLKITQPIYTGGKIENMVRLARTETTLQKELERREREDLCRAVSEAYFSILSARDLREVASQALFDTLGHEERVRNLLEAGTALKNDVLKIHVSVLDREEQLLRAQNAVILACQNLSNLTGLEISPEGEFSGFGFRLPPPTGYDETMNLAMQHHPLILALDKKIDIKKTSVDLAKADRRPSVGLQGSYNSGSQLNEAQKNWDATLYVGYTLFDAGEVQARVREERSGLEKQRQEYEDVKRKIGLAIQQALLKLTEADRRQQLSAKAEEQANESRRMTVESHQVGAATSQDLLDSETALASARNRHVTAQHDRSLAEVALWHTFGCLEPALDATGEKSVSFLLSSPAASASSGLASSSSNMKNSRIP